MSRVRRKSTSINNNHTPNTKRSKTVDLGYNEKDDNDDHVESDDSDNERRQRRRMEEDSDDDVEEEETLDAKKIRLAKEYLQRIETADSDDDSEEGSDDDEDGMDRHDRVGLRLQKERLKREGTYERPIAAKVENSISTMYDTITTNSNTTAAADWISAGHVRLCRGHDLTATCVDLQSGTGERALSGSKDHSIILWDVETAKQISYLSESWKTSGLDRNLGEVLSVACSDDGRYAAVGRRDATVCIYDIRARQLESKSGKNAIVKTFTGHKAPITSLAFRTNSSQLFSGSEDRCVRHYNLNEMIYLETLYGHQFGVTGVDCHRKERPITVGRDRTARAWKLSEDSHLIFRGGAKVASPECVTVLRDDYYLTGHEDGNLALWFTDKKKSIKAIQHAHGLSDPKLNVGRSIVSVGCLKGGDMALTGSSDGFLRLWKVSTGATLSSRDLAPLQKIPVNGYINDIAVGPQARFCVVATGQEHRLGRWNRIAKAKNRFGIIRLRTEEDVANDNEEVDDVMQEEEPEYNSTNDDSD